MGGPGRSKDHASRTGLCPAWDKAATACQTFIKRAAGGAERPRAAGDAEGAGETKGGKGAQGTRETKGGRGRRGRRRDQGRQGTQRAQERPRAALAGDTRDRGGAGDTRDRGGAAMPVESAGMRCRIQRVGTCRTRRCGGAQETACLQDKEVQPWRGKCGLQKSGEAKNLRTAGFEPATGDS